MAAGAGGTGETCGGAGETGGGAGFGSINGSGSADNPQDDKTAMHPISNPKRIHSFFLNRLPGILKKTISK